MEQTPLDQVASTDVTDQEFTVRWQGPAGEEEGPLYVLWQLIESYRIDIFEISIHSITEDFLAFIERATSLQMELVSSFALMAARLVYYKSRAMLPDPGFEEPENESRLPPELIEQLLEYRRFQIAADVFTEMEEMSAFMLSRPTSTESAQSASLTDSSFDAATANEEHALDVVDLVQAYVSLMQRLDKAKEPEFVMQITGEELTVEDRITMIRSLFSEVDGCDFFDLFDRQTLSRSLIVVTLLAVLELARLHEIVIVQPETFAAIQLFRRSAIVS